MALEELAGRLNHREYRNWLRAGQCLLLLRAGLLPFTAHNMRAFHGDLLNQQPALRRPCEGSGCRSKGNTLVSACKVCSHWQSVILRHHRHPGTSVNWDNCSPPRWRTDPWEVAKAYMPRGQSRVKEADQCDAAALLNLINHCDRFHAVETKLVREVICYRNELMHSCEMHVKEEWMSRYEIALKNLLKQLSHIPHMDSVRKQIEEVLTIDLSVSVSLDQMDAADDWLECDSVSQWEISATSFSQWEAELLAERLKELLHAAAEGDDDDDDDEAKSQDAEQLKSLCGFLKANSDLREKFSAELQSIDSLQGSR